MKKNITISLILLATLLFSSCKQKTLINLVQDGKSNYQIIITESADEYEQKAADELHLFIEEISGAHLDIIKDNADARTEHSIILGKDNMKLKDIHLSFEELGKDGFIIKTDKKNIIIAGNNGLSTLYGVYSFLEDNLGVRKYTPDFTFLTRNKDIAFELIDRKDIPLFSFRQVHIINGYHHEYALWHKLHNSEVRDKDWGMYVHTFDDFIPAEKYFETNPEYFSLINDKRVPDAQICLSNEEVYDIIVDDLKERIKDNPEAKYWSVSQNDTYYPCQCDKCKALDEQYGGPSGAMLWFVNKVAREFPEKHISMLAYQYTRQAPKNIIPEKNTNIMLCTIECNRSKPIAGNSGKGSFARDIVDWGKLTDNIYLWDYVVQFRNYANPFPNLRVLQPNIQFFRDNNVRMMFQQGSGGSTSEFHNLRAYIISKLLWNPDADVDVIIGDFVNNYYGPAAPFILEYITTMHDALEKSNATLGIYGYPWDGAYTYLTPELLDKYTELFDKAEEVVKDDTVYYDRYRFARVPLEYAILEISRRNITPKYSIFLKEYGIWKINPEMEKRLELFVKWANDMKFERFDEHGHPTPDEYHEEMLEYFKKGRVIHLASGKPVTLTRASSEKYDVGGAQALTDEKKGAMDWHCNYLGFEGSRFEAIIDLEEEKEVSDISIDFIQDHVYWIFAPGKVSFYTSMDGKNYSLAGTDILMSDKKAINFVESYNCSFTKVKCRYIKVVSDNYLKCPEWHKGAGGKAWVFTDEIVVN